MRLGWHGSCRARKPGTAIATRAQAPFLLRFAPGLKLEELKLERIVCAVRATGDRLVIASLLGRSATISVAGGLLHLPILRAPHYYRYIGTGHNLQPNPRRLEQQ